MARWIFTISAVGFLTPALCLGQTLVEGHLYSYEKNGVRHYTSTLDDAENATNLRAFTYQMIEGLEAVTQDEIAYRCRLGDGTYADVIVPYAGCVVIKRSRSMPAAQQPNIFRRCTQDCSGHRAGYEWARSKGIQNPEACGGNSQSFIEGCQAFASGAPPY